MHKTLFFYFIIWIIINTVTVIKGNIMTDLTKEEIIVLSKELNIEPALLHTVITVLSKKPSFHSSGNPTISFEGHLFWYQLKRRGKDPYKYIRNNNDILYVKWTDKYHTKDEEWAKLNRAKNIHNDAAITATLWGAFQIIGHHYKRCGFNTPVEFMEYQCECVQNQIKSFIAYLKDNDFLNLLINHQWSDFLKYYKSPGGISNGGYRLETIYSEVEKLYR